MSFISLSPETSKGQSIGTGHCVPYVQQASNAPATAQWKKGRKVRGDTTIQKGTAIATFSADGKYTNSLDGTSHAAIYLRQDGKAIYVLDQWINQPVHERAIRFQGGKTGRDTVNDGDNYYVVELMN
jgi:hypothetical protein